MNLRNPLGVLGFMSGIGESLGQLGNVGGSFKGFWGGQKTPGVYSSTGATLGQGQGLASLGSCQGLEELTLEVGDVVLDAKARAAVAGLQELKVLNLAVATDVPLALVREYVGWLGAMKGLKRLRVGFIGAGGCEEGQQGLVEALRRALPGCEVERP